MLSLSSTGVLRMNTLKITFNQVLLSWLKEGVKSDAT